MAPKDKLKQAASKFKDRAKEKLRAKAGIGTKAKSATESLDGQLDRGPLTFHLKKLNRTILSRLYRGRREKVLQSLQDSIRGLNADGIYGLRVALVKNVTKEFKDKRTEMAKELKEERINEFIDDVMGVGPEVDALEKVAEKHAKYEGEEKVFYGTLKHHCGQEVETKALKEIVKLPAIKYLLTQMKDIDAKTHREMNHAIETGDYPKLRKIIAEKTEMDETTVDTIFGSARFMESGIKKKTGFAWVDKLIYGVETLKTIGFGYVLSQCAKEAKVPFFLVMRMGEKTMADIRAIDDNLRDNKDLILKRKVQTVQNQTQLSFIDNVSKLRGTLEKRLTDKDVHKRFDSHLNAYLEKLKKERKLDAKAIINIKLHAKPENLKLRQMCELIYGEDEDRDRLFFRLFMRIPTAYRLYKRIWGEKRDLVKTLYQYNKKRFQKWEVRKFRIEAKRWGLSKIAGDMDALEMRVKKEGGKIGDLFEEVAAHGQKGGEIDVTTDRSRIDPEALYEHDKIVKKFYILSRRTSQLLSEQARELLGIGKSIETVKASKVRAGIDFNECSVDDMNLSKATKDRLFRHSKFKNISRADLKGKHLVAAFGEELIEMRTAMDVSRARFAALADTIQDRVTGPFAEKWGEKMERASRSADVSDMREDLKAVKRSTHKPTMIKRWGGRLILPTFLLGQEVHALATGKAKPREFMWDVGEAAAGFVPVVGTILDFKAAFSGKSLSGRKLGLKEQILSGFFGVVGAIADVTTVFGGFGLGLRGGIGFLKNSRRAVRIAQQARRADKVLDVRHVGAGAKQSMLTRFGAWVGGKYNKSARLDRATEAYVAAKSYEQARLLSELHDIDKTFDTGGDVLKQLNKMKKGTNNKVVLSKIKRLKQLSGSSGQGLDYMKAMSDYIKAVEVPTNAMGRWILRQKARWNKMKAYFLRIGVNADLIRKYEKSFDEIRKAETQREAAVKALKDLTRKREMTQRTLKLKLEALEATESAHRTRLAKLVRNEEKALGATRTEKDAFDVLIHAHKAKGRFGKLLLNLREGKVTGSSAAIIKRIERAAPKGMDPKELKRITDQYEELHRSRVMAKGVGRNRKSLMTKLRREDPEGVKMAEEINGLQKELKQGEAKFQSKKDHIRNINSKMRTDNAARFDLESKMMLKAQSAMARADNWRRVIKCVQWGGLAIGGFIFLTSRGPGKELKAIGGGIHKGGKVAYKGGKYVLWEDHAGTPPLDRYIAGQVRGAEKKGKKKKTKRRVVGAVKKAAGKIKPQQRTQQRKITSGDSKTGNPMDTH